MRQSFTCMAVAVLIVFGLTTVSVFAGEKPADNGRGPVVEAMVDMFKEKGTFSDADAAALKEQMKNLPEGRALESLARELNKKGVITDEEASELTSKIISSRLPGGDIEITLDYLEVIGAVTSEEDNAVRTRLNDSPLGKEKAYYESVAAYVSTEIRKEMEGQYKKEIQAEAVKEAKAETKKMLPDWTNRIKLYGDIRLRYQGDFFDQNNDQLQNPSNPAVLLNTTTDRQRLRLRARLGATAAVNDEVEAGLRITTGDTTNPVSTTSTLDDYYNRKAITLDLAYLKWSITPNLYFIGGRVPNPWLCSDLVWAPDLNFDGLDMNYSARLAPNVAGFVNAGVFPVQEVEFSTRDKWLFAGQVGVQYKPSPHVSGKLAVAYYDFENLEGRANDPAVPNTNDYTSPLYQQKGNTLMNINPSGTQKLALAADFRELNVTGYLDLGYWEPVHAVFLADYVRNLGFDLDQVRARTNSDQVLEDIDGYQLGVALGYPEVNDFAQWKGYIFYKYLGADCVVDAFTDPDFHLGGTNAKGWIIGGEFGLKKNFWLSGRWISSNEISGPPLSIDTLQVNLNGRF